MSTPNLKVISIVHNRDIDGFKNFVSNPENLESDTIVFSIAASAKNHESEMFEMLEILVESGYTPRVYPEFLSSDYHSALLSPSVPFIKRFFEVYPIDATIFESLKNCDVLYGAHNPKLEVAKMLVEYGFDPFTLYTNIQDEQRSSYSSVLSMRDDYVNTIEESENEANNLTAVTTVTEEGEETEGYTAIFDPIDEDTLARFNGIIARCNSIIEYYHSVAQQG
jgi:hypothetical protein